MTTALAMGLGLLMIGTALLSGVFGMAGGLILIGVLLFIFPLPTAMVLHAVTQMARAASCRSGCGRSPSTCPTRRWRF